MLTDARGLSDNLSGSVLSLADRVNMQNKRTFRGPFRLQPDKRFFVCLTTFEVSESRCVCPDDAKVMGIEFAQTSGVKSCPNDKVNMCKFDPHYFCTSEHTHYVLIDLAALVLFIPTLIHRYTLSVAHPLIGLISHSVFYASTRFLILV